MKDSSFASVPRSPHATTEGPVSLPIHYRDASLFGVFFAADLAACRALGLAGKKPLASFRTDTFRARLPAGVDVGNLGA